MSARQATSNTFEHVGVCVGAARSWSRRPCMWETPSSPARRSSGSRRRHQPAGTDFALGIEARCQALLSDGDRRQRLCTAKRSSGLSRTRLRPELARAHLLYGEWLRREGRRVDAREQLRTAHDLLDAIGMEAFAERARRELLATGEKVRKRTRRDARRAHRRRSEQIARLARDGLSNPEIGARLFVSPRTVEWHLRNVFAKLGITSRRQLKRLPEDGRSRHPHLAGVRSAGHECQLNIGSLPRQQRASCCGGSGRANDPRCGVHGFAEAADGVRPGNHRVVPPGGTQGVPLV